MTCILLYERDTKGELKFGPATWLYCIIMYLASIYIYWGVVYCVTFVFDDKYLTWITIGK